MPAPRLASPARLLTARLPCLARWARAAVCKADHGLFLALGTPWRRPCPVLLQLSAVIDRLLGMPVVAAPLKAMLTGVELLLAKGQLW